MDCILPSTHGTLPRSWWMLSSRFRTRSTADPKRISAPTPSTVQGEYWSYIDCQGDLYRLFWSDSPSCPNLAGFPVGYKFEHIQLSRDTSYTWKHSAYLANGADSCIKEDTNLLPILKLAHPDTVARQRLKREFEMLQTMSEYALPLARFCPEPFVDKDGIYGYRMERLYNLDFNNLSQYYEKVKLALSRVHEAGFALGDLHPGNTMLNEKKELVFIDLAYAGKIGEEIPSCVSTDSHQQSVFHTEPDIQRLHFFVCS